MAGHRPARIAEMIHKELAQRLRLEIKDPRIGDVSITHVHVSGDLRSAKIQFMPLGGGPPSDEMIAGLRDAAKRLRGPIGRALRLRNAPELRFEVDSHTEEAVRMTSLLDELERQRAERESSDQENN